MHHINSIAELSDRDLLDATERVAASERHLAAELLALLGELDVRRLHLGQSCASLFTYCTQVLHFSEHSAYHRIEAARAARQFPVILDLLVGGALTLTTVSLLRPHLTRENHETLLDAARHKSKRAVEHQIACLAPRPDERSVVRKLASPVQPSAPAPTQEPVPLIAPLSRPTLPDVTRVLTAEAHARPITTPRPTIAPLSPQRYLLKMTVGAETHAKLRRAQDLMRHIVPNGDPAVVIDRALKVLIDELERTKVAKTTQLRLNPSRCASSPRRSSSRHIPASIRRIVWARDEGRCAFVGARGRCTETSRLEFHHVVPFADGGPTSVENLALRCQAHNAHEARLWASG